MILICTDLNHLEQIPWPDYRCVKYHFH